MYKKENNLGWRFPIGVDSKTGKIKTNDLKCDIKLSIIIILKTMLGERRIHTDYGSNLIRFMFEPVSYDLIKNIRDEVLRAVTRWEPRIFSVDVDVLNDINNENRIVININYVIFQLRMVDSVNYSFELYSQK